MAKKSYLFSPPITIKVGQKIYYVTDGNKPFAKRTDAVKKAQRIRKNNAFCRVVPMNGEYYIYSKTKKNGR